MIEQHNIDVPVEEISSHLKDDCNGFIILADTRKIEEENRLTQLRSFGVESESEYNDFVKKVEAISDKLDANIRIKVIMIFKNKGD